MDARVLSGFYSVGAFKGASGVLKKMMFFM